MAYTQRQPQPPPGYSAGPNSGYGPPDLPKQAQPVPGYATSPLPVYRQPTSGPHILHVYREGMTHRHAHILDTDKQTPLYRIDCNSGGLFSSKPHMKIYSAASNALVGTVTFHSVSSDMELTIHNRPVELVSSGMFTSAHQFMSLATHENFKWKSNGMFSGGDMLCLDNREQLVAKFESSNWAMKKEGKLELGAGVEGILMDELVVSGIAMVEHRRRKKNASSSAAAGSAGG